MLSIPRRALRELVERDATDRLDVGRVSRLGSPAAVLDPVWRSLAEVCTLDDAARVCDDEVSVVANVLCGARHFPPGRSFIPT